MLALPAVGIAHAEDGADPGGPCRVGLGDADAALIAATQARQTHRPGGPVPLHLLTRANPSGCARVRFGIDVAGGLQEPVLEVFYPNPRFGREILALVRAMRFTPAAAGSRDDALLVVDIALDSATFDETDP